MRYQTFEVSHPSNRSIENVKRVIAEAYENGCEATALGKPADYIPELAKANGNDFGICMMNSDGDIIEYGDVNTGFSIQSISKVINLAACLKFRGYRDTFSHVLMEPTGDEFNSILKLDTKNDLPFNPFINAGAIQIVSMLVDMFDFSEMLSFAKLMCMDDEITLNEKVYESERDTGDRNRAIAFLLKSKGVLMSDPMKTIDLYFRLCSLNVTAKSLAGLGLVLSNGGMNPYTGKHLIAPNYVRTIKALMFTCGMYDFSGEWGVRIGIPSKSGVGGGVVCAADGNMGFGLYGPSLDKNGNSVAAISAMEHISHLLNLHAFDTMR